MSEKLGSDFNLPEEILSVIPTDPYEQLDLARKITSMAIASRSAPNLEAEMAKLKQTIEEKDRLILQLQDRVSQLQQSYRDAELQLRITSQDNMKLIKERDSFSMTAKKLSRDLAKMDRFKRQLMQSLNEDDPSQAETVDAETCEQGIPKAYTYTKENNCYTTLCSSKLYTDGRSIIDDDIKTLTQTGQRVSATPYITPLFTPTATPKAISTNGSPRRYFAVESPQTFSGATSPTRAQYEGRVSLSSWYPSSQQSSAASSPPRRSTTARTPQMNGKEFFRQARSRLSYEQFSAFLANIKELNAQKQSREETLKKAEEIFGTDNRDLYMLFQGLLNRNTKS